MNPRFTALVDRLTQRLRLDPELQREVAEELRSHLEASAAEYEAAGEQPQEAEAQAMRALGDEQALAEQLWRANRGRVRMRFWLKWAGRVAVAPLLVAAVVLFALPGMIKPLELSWLVSAVDGGGGLPAHDPTTGREAEMRKRLPDEQALIIFGDAEANDRAARERAVHEAFPDEPMYFANYVAAELHDWPVQSSQNEEGDVVVEVDEARMSRLLELFERGRQIEPDNAYYDLLTGTLLLQASGELYPREDLAYAPAFAGRTEQVVPHGWRTTDPARFEAGLAAIQQAAQKPYLRGYAVAMELHRQSLMPEVRQLGDVLYRQARAVGVLLPGLHHWRRATQILAGESLTRFEAGDPAAAEALLRLNDRLANLAAADTKTAIELLVAYGMYMEGLTARWIGLQIAGDDAAAGAARQKLTTAYERRQRTIISPDDEFEQLVHKRGSLVANLLMPAGPGDFSDLNMRASREAEHLVVDQAALGMIVMLAALGVVGGTLAVGVIGWRRRGRGDAPLLLWIGWRRLALVLLVSVAVPLAVYAGWVWWPGPGSYLYGLGYVLGRRLVEVAMLLVLIGVFGWHISAWAMRRRAWELGIAQPQRSRPAWLEMAVLAGPLALLLGLYFVFGQRLAGPGQVSWADVFTALAVILWGIAWLAWAVAGVKGFELRWPRLAAGGGGVVLIAAVGAGAALLMDASPWGAAMLAMATLILAGGVGVISLIIRRSDYGQFAASFARTGVPLAATVALLLAATAGPLLQTLETQRAQRIATVDELLLLNEADRTRFRQLREHLIHETTAERAGRTASGR